MKEENHDHHDVIDSLYFGKLSLKDLISMTQKEIIFIYSYCFKSFQTFKERLSDQFIIMKIGNRERSYSITKMPMNNMILL